MLPISQSHSTPIVLLLPTIVIKSGIRPRFLASLKNKRSLYSLPLPSLVIKCWPGPTQIILHFVFTSSFYPLQEIMLFSTVNAKFYQIQQNQSKTLRHIHKSLFLVMFSCYRFLFQKNFCLLSPLATTCFAGELSHPWILVTITHLRWFSMPYRSISSIFFIFTSHSITYMNLLYMNSGLWLEMISMSMTCFVKGNRILLTIKVLRVWIKTLPKEYRT